MSVGAREPCPCGSGRRYKACHGKEASKATTTYSSRPFAGLPQEPNWVAMREILPSATADVRLKDGSDITFVTLLPENAAAMRGEDGQNLVALQTLTNSGDASRDIAAAVLAVRSLKPGELLSAAPMGGQERLQDLVPTDATFALTLHQDFDYWGAAGQESAPGVATHAIPGTPSAFWCDFTDRQVLRWALDLDEDQALDALARLTAAGEHLPTPEDRYLGAFRADGLLIPVWQIHRDAEGLAEPLAALAERLRGAVGVTTPLSATERRARAGLIGRNVTLR
jgi:hypothetical protein